MGGLSLTHILVIALFALIFFGPSRLPSLGQSLGKAIRGFKQGLNEIDVDPKDIQDTPQQVQHQKKSEQQSQKQSETRRS